MFAQIRKIFRSVWPASVRQKGLHLCQSGPCNQPELQKGDTVLKCIKEPTQTRPVPVPVRLSCLVNSSFLDSRPFLQSPKHFINPIKLSNCARVPHHTPSTPTRVVVVVKWKNNQWADGEVCWHRFQNSSAHLSNLKSCRCKRFVSGGRCCGGEKRRISSLRSFNP